ncbi:hypothetical protein JYT79_02650, partial [Cardiobacterium sp. AH-315-I02]|nr:hypothetical protein [Cardiobacterium sp. AH-315-I02]
KENSTMYAVIFKAEINKIDKAYSAMAIKMRDLAINEYGCIKFNSVTEGNNEIAISYWNTKEQIKKWKQNKEHLKAQELGKNKWYKEYSVEIVEVISQYENI